MKKIKRRLMAMSTVMTMLASSSVSMMPANAEAMRSIYYTAGDVDNMVSASTFIFAVPEHCSFEYCDSSRFSRKGYKLISWYVQETGETVGTQQPSFMPEYDLHVVANWEPVTYSICLAGAGGITDAGENNIYVNGTYGTTITLPSNPFKRDGYTFGGWEYDGVIYNDASDFKVPGVISGGRIVLAAVWNRGSQAVTTAPVQEEVTTTTTTTVTSANAAPTTTTLADDQLVRTFSPDSSFNYVNDSFKVYVSDIIGRYDTAESIEFRFETDADKVGNVSTGFATALTNGQSYQQNFGEYVADNNFTIRIDKNICEQLSYSRYLQFVCWHSDSYPLRLAEVKAIVKENVPAETTDEYEEEEEPVVTTVSESVNTETTTSTTVSTIAEIVLGEESSEEETTVSVPEGLVITFAPETEEATTESSTSETSDIPDVNGGAGAPETSETTAATTAETTETEPSTSTEPVQVIEEDRSRYIYIGQRVQRDTAVPFKVEDMLFPNEKLISIDVTFRTDGESFGQYSFGTYMNTSEGSLLNYCFADRTDESYLTVTAMADSDVITIDSNTQFNVGYWWGEHETITIESITVNYTSSEPLIVTEPVIEPKPEPIESNDEPVIEPVEDPAEEELQLEPLPAESGASPIADPEPADESEPETEPETEPEPELEIDLQTKDYDGDGAVTNDDVAILQKFLVGAAVDGVDHDINDYDINGDGKVNVFDSIALQRILRNRNKD